MKLSIVILNWNAANDTIRCVHNIVGWKQIKPTIWIVDNASSDDSVQTISQQCPSAHLVCNNKNLGFAGGSNQGIIRALDQGDYPILLLNNDASISEPDIIRLMQTLDAHKDIGLVGPLLFASQHQDHLLSAGGKNPVLHHHPRLTRAPKNKPIFPVGYVLGTVVLIRAQVFRTIGLLDEDYFFIAEVADFNRRARKVGYKTITDARARAFHDLNRSSKFRDTLYVYYTIRNRFIFIRKFYQRLKIPLGVFWTVYSLALLLKLKVTGKGATAQAIYLGLIDGIQGRFGGQNERVLAKLSNEH